MADNVTLPATGTGTATPVIAADDVSSVFYQRVKLDAGGDGATLPIVDEAVPSVLLPIGGKVIRGSQTPTVTNGAYGIGDAMGGLLTFSNAARASGGSIIIEAATLVDLSKTDPLVDLVLFDRTFTNTADNAPFDPSDSDILNIIGVIQFNIYADFNDNSAAYRTGLGLAAKLNGTDLFGQLVTRSAVTLTSTSDITVILHMTQN